MEDPSKGFIWGRRFRKRDRDETSLGVFVRYCHRHHPYARGHDLGFLRSLVRCGVTRDE